MTFDSFMDLKSLQEEWGYNFTIDTEGKTVNWNEVKVLHMVKSEPLQFSYKTSYSDDNFRTVDIRNKRKKMKQITEITIKKAYDQKQELSKNKKKI